MSIRRSVTSVAAVLLAASTLLVAPVTSSAPGASDAHAATSRPKGSLISVGAVDPASSAEYRDNAYASTADGAYEYLSATGRLGIVKYNATRTVLTVDRYNTSTLRRVARTITIKLSSWPDFGGFYAGPDGYFYVLVGRDNPSDNDSKAVVAVRRYSPGWHLVGTAYIRGGASQEMKGINAPFTGSAAHMLLVGNRLVVDMSRDMYLAAASGQHHEANLTFQVYVPTMKATPFQDLGGYSYASHSFQELVAMNGQNLVMIDHGDAYPREIQMGVMADYPSKRVVKTYDLYTFNGAIGQNYTGAAVTGIVSGPSGVVVLGDSERPGHVKSAGLFADAERRNIFAITADPATGKHAVHWLTHLSPHSRYRVTEPRVVQVAPDRYAVLFAYEWGKSSSRLEYRLIDSAGHVLAQASFTGVEFGPASAPILIGHTLYWVGNKLRTYAGERIGSGKGYLYGLYVKNLDKPRFFARSAH